jgi:1-deoxy-D-xylulose-5-phosphate reductoisomerase
MKKISLLGATGSIGTQTIEIIRANPDKFKLVGLAVGKNIKLASHFINELNPAIVSVERKSDADLLKKEVSGNVKITYGQEGLIDVASHPDSDIVLNAVMGSVGLAPTLAAIECGKTIALANKETLISAGHIVMEKASRFNVSILPVDSEHSAIFQCLNGEKKKEVSRLIITASGGSFRDKTREELIGVTVKEALQHPNWAMGSKITIDSATMMNKGLEVIEAHWLFGIPYSEIDVLLHKESIIHSLVEFIDNSVIAHLGHPDMKVPIQYALTYPDRLEISSGKKLNLWELGSLNFDKADFRRYPCLEYAFQAGTIGGTMPTVLNAANEIAVDAFLNNKISFLEIENYIEAALTEHDSIKSPTLDDIILVDQETRQKTLSKINKGG